MTLHDETREAPPGTVRMVFDLAHPPARVWRALTTPELLSKWLLQVDALPLETGAAFVLRTDPQPGWDGVVNARVHTVEEPHRFAFDWVVGPLDTHVVFTLEPTAAGTRLVMEQSGFQSGQEQNLGGARYGWRMMGGRLVELLDGGVA